MAIRSFQDLEVWKVSMKLVVNVYRITREMPTHERFGLASQMQRAAVSIPSNIAEGSKRTSRADFRQFCLIALGSAAELETQLLLTGDLYPKIGVSKELEIIVQVQKMLTALAKQLHISPPKTVNHQP